MGILAEPLRFIEELKLPKGFSVCELGDQFITSGDHKYLAREWYEKRGCARYVCIDANGQNGALVIDLNKPLWTKYLSVHAHKNINRGTFDLVTDFGTGEHIFDQAQVWETMHMLAKPGGLLAFDRPSAGYEGHCFYLIQWNLVTALAHANNYEVICLEEERTTRGILLRGALRKREDELFKIPQQGRYVPKLRIKTAERGVPDWKSKELRAAGVVGRPKE